MGNSSATQADLSARRAHRAATGTSFGHTTAMRSKPHHLQTIHTGVDPKGLNTAGEQVRECRDSDEHPTTIPVVVAFDETGSMGEAPRVLLDKLATLKGATLRAGLPDVQLCFAAYGDAQNDEVAPCQVGQFEAGLEMDDWLNALYLERMGGSNGGETAALLLYFLAEASRLDSLEKRGKKGYLFITGDEVSLPYVTQVEVQRYLGDDFGGLERDLTVAEAVAMAQEKYDIYFFLVETGSAVMQGSLEFWQGLLGKKHVIVVEGLDHISEQIAMMVARLEGVVDTIDEAGQLLLGAGADAGDVQQASQALTLFEDHATSVANVATGEGTLPEPAVAGSTKRL